MRKGYKHTEETKAKMSKAQLGSNNHMYRKKHTDETLAKMSDSNHHMYGKNHTEKARAKMSKARSGSNNPMYGRKGKDSPMYGRVGKDNPNYGSKRTKETKAKMSGSNCHLWREGFLARYV